MGAPCRHGVKGEGAESAGDMAQAAQEIPEESPAHLADRPGARTVAPRSADGNLPGSRESDLASRNPTPSCVGSIGANAGEQEMPGAKLTKETLELVRRLNAAGWTDNLIAEVVGISQSNVCLARKRLGLRAAYRGRTKEAMRRTRQGRFEESLARLSGDEPAGGSTPLDLAVAQEEAERLLAPGDARTRHVLLLRGQGWTLERIGGLFGITRERVRQILAQATQGRRP